MKYAKIPKLTNICPLTLMREDGPHDCCQNQCHWWVTWNAGTDHELSECIVHALGYLADMN